MCTVALKQGNLLSKPVDCQGLKVIDLTKEKDFTNPDTVKDIMKNIKGSGDVSFIVHRALVVRRGSV